MIPHHQRDAISGNQSAEMTSDAIFKSHAIGNT